MPIFKTNRRWIVWGLIVCFLYLVQFTSMPVGAENTTGENESESPTVIEEESSLGPTVEKRSILPWVLIGLGVVAVGVAVYFLVIKKSKYVLTVTIGDGVSGTPVSGSYEYKKGEVLSYNYTLDTAHKDLSVTLDGVAAADSGTIIMDKNHTLEVKSSEGLHEDFDTTPSDWLPRNGNEWRALGGYYVCTSNATINYNYNIYDHSWSQPDYTVTVRLMRSAPTGGVKGIALNTTNNLTDARGFEFNIGTSGNGFIVFKNNGFNYSTSLGNFSTLFFGNYSAINSGINVWNTIKVIKTGSSYTIYVNDTTLHSFSDSTYDPRYVALAFANPLPASIVSFDYVYVDVGSAAAFPVGQPPMLLKNPKEVDRNQLSQW